MLDTARNDDALRTAIIACLREQDAVFELPVQLCTGLQTMPIEDASTERSEEQSPCRTIARLRLPRQDAYSGARRDYVDKDLSFCVSHSLAAHRPWDSIMRARLRACPEMSRRRRQENGRPLGEPRSADEVPA